MSAVRHEMLRLVSAWALLCVGAAGAQAQSRAQAAPQPQAASMKPAARAHLERGLRLYDLGRFEAASREFQAGYQIDPQPDFLYAAGQAYRKLGDCRKAAEYYRRFLQTGPAPPQAAAVGALLERCETDVAAEVPPLTPAPTPASAPAPARVRSPPGETASGPVASTHVTAPPSAEPAPLHVFALLFGDVVSTQGGAEVGLGFSIAPTVDLGAAASLGDSVGVRFLMSVHSDRTSTWGWLVELRGLVQPLDAGTAVGLGALLGTTLEAGPGRLLVGVAGDFYSGPDRYYPYAVLGMAGYELDLLGGRWP